MTKTQTAICTAICLSLTLCSGCQNKKPSELDKNEKIHFQIESEKELTPEERQKQTEVRKNIIDRTERTKESEKAMQNAIASAKEVLSEKSFQDLLNNQNDWNTQGRGKDINILVKKGISSADAFAKAAFDRAEWIQTHTSQAMLIEMPGQFGGFYRTPDNRTLEIYEMPDKKLNLILRSPDAAFTYTASGTIQDGHIRMTSEIDKNAAVNLTANTKDIIIIELDASFATSQIAVSGTLIEGRFERVKPGDMNVFAP